ncbi:MULTISPECIES: molybdopterin-dependent oxidoreductase [Shimia]|uniref:molybdopterin-dependent oxidoreductase n=1 Tax=Shimia TaxID=573139 RepID=UPI001FB2EDAB|nr:MULTISPECIES: molybdopterin-dependent oxidoreductase [Shimia]MDV4146145.1 molybdopterin-dependent oxidoreductase [Shimia sp. FJ5]
MLRFLMFLGLSLGVLVGPAVADEVPRPEGEVLLTVSGEIANTNAEGAAQFDMDMLMAMPATRFRTTTLWTEGVKTFKGVSLIELLEVVGVNGKTLRATALNDYSIEIPVDSIQAGAPIVAYEMDGETMSRRQKGPLWIVYPYDSDEDFRTEVIYSRSIWQLDRIEIVK